MTAFPYVAVFMLSKPYDFRQFQNELSALDAASSEPPAHSAAPVTTPASRLARAKAEFLALRDRYQLSVADVVAFFPEEEGIVYLQSLIAASAAKPGRRRTKAG
ncbi:MAG TPA: 2-hydroxyacyl-CoA dehydratase [Rhodanobacter sp.]|nr:2-hydroxyacyl-CoA dehydratase [Rhodanobacter sp.]